jgi:hypothetical protein
MATPPPPYAVTPPQINSHEGSNNYKKIKVCPAERHTFVGFTIVD